MCHTCGYTPCTCRPAATTTEWLTLGSNSPCVAKPICKTKIPAKCVIYTGPNLVGLGLGSNIDVELILSTISTVVNQNRIKISQDPCNSLTLGTDGGLLLDIDALLSCLNERGCDPCGTGNCICVAPTDLTVVYDQSGITNFETYRANISWTASAGAQAYTLEYKLSSASNWQIIASNITGTSNNTLILDLTGVTAKSYDFRIKALCSGCDSIYVYTNNQTVAKCPVPNNLTIN